MRHLSLLLILLLAAACVAVGPVGVSAQQSSPRQQQSAADLAAAYEAWLGARDAEEKIRLGEQALAVEPKVDPWSLPIPRQRFKAELLAGLGSLYVTRTRGVSADNQEKAIGYLQSALTGLTREADPQDWASAHNALGIAHWQRIRGERADNQETAIAHFEAAQTVFSREAEPEQWAQLQNNLAAVYLSRIRGDRAQNVEEAIARFEAALTVFTREKDPDRWAAAQNNLANAYGKRLRGDEADNREMAIAHLEAALSVFARDTHPGQWAQVQNNLAIAYSGRTRGDAADNQEKAIASLEAALTVFTPDAAPQLWAQAQHNLGRTYAGRIQGERTSNRQKAIACFEAALTVFTRDAAPLDHLRTSRMLGRVLLEAGEWTRVAPIHASARQAFTLLFGQGVSEAEARTLIADAGPLFADSAYAALQRHETEKAFELANEGRARLLAVALKLQTIDLPADQRRRLDELRVAIRAGQEAADAAQGTARADAIDRLIGLRRELFALVDRDDKGGAAPVSALAEARRIAAAGGIVVMPVVTDLGAKLLIVGAAKPGVDVTVLDVPDLSTGRLVEVLVGPPSAPNTGWIGAYLVNYMDGQEAERRWPEWIAAIDGIGPELWRLFAGKLEATLKERGVKRGTRLVWLPSGWLGILPLGLAQDPASKHRLAEDYQIVYAPSLAALTSAHDLIASPQRATLAAIVNPTGDLPGTEKEGALVAAHFAGADRTVLEGEAATPEAVIASLKGKTHWHFASHGSFSWADARQSALLMHDAAPLTVGRLLEADGLGRPRLVVLSACETGLSDITSSPDEFIGLPGTFTALGAAGVLGTLWPVSDAATALLIGKFYDLHLEAGLDPPAALSGAQAWLRDATGDDLNDYAEVAAARGRLQPGQLASIAEELKPGSLARSRRNAPLDATTGSSVTGAVETVSPSTPAHPYAHPYYWAGFIYTGQ
jgi:CHAT domain-containing protein/tetratricopeptide (TPR) repeat protein